jgi:prepilin peptidase CpaA
MSVSFDIFLFFTVLGSITDIMSRRIPNLMTYGAAALVLIASAFSGPATFAFALLWLVVTIVAGSVIFGRGWIGGGDIKLMAVGASAIGYPNFFIVLLYIAIAGGIVAAAAAARKNTLRQTVYNVAFSAATGNAIVPDATSSRIPYALAICAGSFFYAATESIAPWLRLAH